METLTLAFDITIVGALALTWVLLVVHLFFLKCEKATDLVLGWVSEKNLQAVAGVLLFAMTFTLGAAVSRIAQDFFNDDDLHVPNLLRMAMTEDRIIASVYCASHYNHLLQSTSASPALRDKICKFRCLTANGSAGSQNAAAGTADANPGTASPPDWCTKEEQNSAAGTNPNPGGVSVCAEIVNPSGRYDEKEDNLIKTARDIFGLEENALLLKGQDATLRLRQLHDQIMVLRGATFDGLVTFTLCLFAWGVRLRREKPRSLGRWVLAAVPAFILFLGIDALTRHFGERFAIDPPYMEFSVFAVAAAGIVLLWLPPLETSREASRIRWNWPALSLLFAVLVVGGALGWWATEVFYGEQVIYSYDSGATAVK